MRDDADVVELDVGDHEDERGDHRHDLSDEEHEKDERDDAVAFVHRVHCGQSGAWKKRKRGWTYLEP